MNRSTLIMSILALAFLLASPAHAQVRVTTVSADIGQIRNLQSFSDNTMSINPRLMVGGPIFEDALLWRIYWSYWDDGVDEPFPVADGVTYSHSSHIFGIRVVLTEKMPPGRRFAAHLIVGLAHHFIAGEYVGGLSWGGVPEKDFTEGITTAEIGLEPSMLLNHWLRLKLVAEAYVPLRQSDRFPANDLGASLRIGFDYSFR